MMRERNVPAGALACALVVVLSCAASPALAQNGAVDGQWRAYAADLGATKYSSLDQIDAGNVDQLEIAWTRPTVDQSILDVVPNLGYSNANRSTPLMVDGIVYAPNAVGLVEAWDPATGETIWVQQPFEEAPAGFRGAGHRGIAFWTDGTERRIIAHRGEWLYALDPATGEPFGDFGDNGRVDLKTGLAEGARYRWGGAATVVRDTIVMGQSMGDTFYTKEDIRGDVRAFDVRTGELKWVFHTIPQAGEYGTQTWGDGSWEFSGHAPVWSLFAADEELGYVYMHLFGHQRHVRRAPARRQPLAVHRVRRRGDGRARLALPACPPRPVGLRHPGRADPGRPYRRRARRQGGDPDHQAGVRLRVRPGDRRADLADRGAAGAAVGHPGRGDLSDAAVSDEAAGVRPPGGDRREPDRLHAGIAGGGARDRRALHHPMFTPPSVRGGGRTTTGGRSSSPVRRAGRTSRVRRSIRRPITSTFRRSPRRSSPTSSRAIRTAPTWPTSRARASGSAGRGGFRSSSRPTAASPSST